MKRVKREPTVFNKFVQAELARMKEQVRPQRSKRHEKFECENDRPYMQRDASRPKLFEIFCTEAKNQNQGRPNI